MQVLSDSAKVFCILIHKKFQGWLNDTMQHISYGQSVPKQSRGGRVSSAQFRYSMEQCEDFAGLEEDTKPYDLLKLVKRTGKAMGFTPAMTELLDYYMAFTREQDWRAGARPIVYQCLVQNSHGSRHFRASCQPPRKTAL